MRHRTCKTGAFSHGLWQGGRFWVAAITWAWELNRDWLERDPDSGERNAPSNEKSGNLSGNFSDPAQNFRFLEKEKYRQHIELEELFFACELNLN